MGLQDPSCGGLEVFTGYELEIAPTRISPEKLGSSIYGTVEYLFNNGPVLKDGERLAVSDTETFIVNWFDGSEQLPPRYQMTLLQKGE